MKSSGPKSPRAGTIRSTDLENDILERLSAGESLNAICHGDNPVGVAESTVRKWAVEDADFGARYARARDVGLDCRADRVIEDARKAKDAGLGRLQFDADRWYLSKMAPKRYGEKPAGDAENPIHIVNTIRREVIDPGA